MWEMFIIAFVKVKHIFKIDNVNKSYKACGLAGYVGNKGGLLLSFNLYNKSYGFLCCHLSSGANGYENRNSMSSQLISTFVNKTSKV